MRVASVNTAWLFAGILVRGFEGVPVQPLSRRYLSSS